MTDLWRLTLSIHGERGLSNDVLEAVRARFWETLRAPDRDAFVHAVIVSSCDVPDLLAEIERLKLVYADLVAACRAAILADRDGDPNPWEYLAEELPPAPPGHPLAGDAE